MRLLASILCACACAVHAQTNDYSSCFTPGEISEYKISWMKLPLAWSRTETELIEFEGKERILIRMTSQTYKAYKHIYDVDDVTEVILDPVTALPIQRDFILHEGMIHKSHFTRFDHAKGIATHFDRIGHTSNTVAIASNTRDVVSFLFAARASSMDQLKEEKQKIYVEGKIYDMSLKVHEEKKIKVPDVGKVPSVKVEPIAEFDGIFLRQGKIFFWVSKEKRRMVTLVEAKVPVGKIKVKLHKVSGPGDDFWAEKEEKK